MRSMTCPDCQGARLNPRRRAVRVGGKTLVELGALPIGEVARFFDALAGQPAADLADDDGPTPLDPLSRTIAEELLKEIRGRLGFLTNVGLHYLTLDRAAPTLSGGEAQRIRLASQVGAGLVGVLYILDEPSIGLHPRDNDRLIATLQRLRDVGNTVIVVEHDEDTMRAADHLVDFGPGPGVKGGEVVAEGTIADLADAADEPHRPVPLGPASRSRSPSERKAADRPVAHDRRRPAEQPQGHRRRVPARPVRLRHRRQRARARARWSATSSATPWPATSTARSPSPASTTGSRGSTSSTRSSTSTSRRSAGRRARTRRRTSSCST